MKIFVSHSSQDAALAQQVVDLLHAALGVLAKDIRCSSVDGYRLPGGANIDATLRAEVENAAVVVALLTKASLQSTYVLFELGARWGNGKPLIALCAPGLAPAAVPSPLSALHTLSSDRRADLHQFVADVGGHLEVPVQAPAAYERHLSQISGDPAGAAQVPAIPAEQVIYAMAGRDLGFDFKGSRAQVWQKVDGLDQPMSGFGEGSLDFGASGILSIRRSNTEGRYEVWLKSYTLGGVEKALVPSNDFAAGTRRFRVDCEAKAAGAAHTLRFVLRSNETRQWVASESCTIEPNNTWTLIRLYFEVAASDEFRLRIDDLGVDRAPSSVQIRQLRLVERADR